MQTVLVTGASGFIASHIILQLLEKGFNVRGTVRKGKSESKFKELQTALTPHTNSLQNLSLAEVDLLDPVEKWVEVMQGCDFVMHVASPFPLSQPKDDQELIRPAVTGVTNVLEAATKTGIQKVVLTSSTTAMIYGVKKDGLFTEENWSDPTNITGTTPYQRSKTLAERAAYEYLEKNPGAIRFSSVLPGFVLGPVLFKSAGSSIDVVKMILKGAYPAVPKVGYAGVDVRSIADLHIKAMLSVEADGQRLAGANYYITLQEIGLILKKAYPEKRIPTRTLPDFLIRLMRRFDSTLDATMTDLGTRKEVSPQKAMDMLGWQPLDKKTSVLDCAKSLIEKELV